MLPAPDRVSILKRVGRRIRGRTGYRNNRGDRRTEQQKIEFPTGQQIRQHLTTVHFGAENLLQRLKALRLNKGAVR